jgi:hypothetical protein
MGPCIIMLKHEVVAALEWHDNGPQDLVTVSLSIQIAMNKNEIVFVVCSLCLPIP